MVRYHQIDFRRTVTHLIVQTAVGGKIILMITDEKIALESYLKQP